MNPCRLVVDGPHPGAWNMALDELLLEQAADQAIASLRVYQWSPATVSLGYFQAAGDRDQHEASRAAPLVRRASGGGALVHDAELTYSVALPARHPLSRGGEPLYMAVHETIVDWLNADFAPQGGRFEICQHSHRPAPGNVPWLCFLRRAPGDVLYRPPQPAEANPLAPDGLFKVCGSAQRRRGSAVLQHGSLVLQRSSQAPELPGIAELTGKPARFDLLSGEFIKKIAGGLRLEGGDIHGVNPQLAAAASELAARKFERSEWNLRR